MERVSDTSTNNTAPYYELFYGVSNNNETGESSESSSVESTPRTGLGFKKTECKSKLVVNVTCQDLSCGTAPRSFTQTARYTRRFTRLIFSQECNFRKIRLIKIVTNLVAYKLLSGSSVVQTQCLENGHGKLLCIKTESIR